MVGEKVVLAFARCREFGLILRAGPLGALAICLALAGCISGEGPAMSLEAVARMRLTSVEVDFAPNASVHFSDAEDEARNRAFFEASQGGDERGGASQTDVPSHERARAATVMKTAFERIVGPRLTGTIPVVAKVTIRRFYVPGALATVVIGGNADVRAGVTLVDAKSGQVLVDLPPERFSSAAAGGGGVIGLAVVAAIDSGEEEGKAGRLARNFSEEYVKWLLIRG